MLSTKSKITYKCLASCSFNNYTVLITLLLLICTPGNSSELTESYDHTLDIIRAYMHRIHPASEGISGTVLRGDSILYMKHEADYFIQSGKNDYTKYNFTQSIQNLNKALKRYMILEETTNVIKTLVHIGKVLEDTGMKREALRVYNKARLVIESYGLEREFRNVYLYMAVINQYKRNYPDALLFYQEFDEFYDSTYDAATLDQVRRLEIWFEGEKKQSQIEIQRALLETRQYQVERNIIRKLFLAISIGIFILLTFFIFKLIKRFYQREKKQASLMEEDLLKSQLNPHFVFNTLGAIQNFVYTNKPFKLSHYLRYFSELTNIILENSKYEYITIQKEINFILLYFQLQKLRFEEKINYSLFVDKEINTGKYLIPPMIIQPIVENSIKHGLLPKESGGLVQIRYIRENNRIRIEIEDNGIGINRRKKLIKKSFGFTLSLANTEKRLKGFDFVDRIPGSSSLHVTDLSEIQGGQTGTRVTFHIPIKKQIS